ncbi:HEPN domain-containing protein [Thermostilla marina]
MTETYSVRELRRMWKPHKERLAETEEGAATNIRFHRACSWLQQAEAADEAFADFALVGRWIAFNALYGKWDDDRREPEPDLAGWRAFVDRMVRLDANGHIASILQEHKRLVQAILDDEYLSRHFWEDPTPNRAKRAKRGKHESHTWYLNRQWTLILDRVLQRIYLLRCQLVHGAATCQGKLNRTSVRLCNTMLDHLVRTFLLIWVESGAGEDWGSLCYPPIHKGRPR